MSTNNKVFQVLVTKDNQALATAGTNLDALLPGQIGIYDHKTNLAIDGSAPIKDFYIAVGADTDGDTVTDAINFSAGQVIQKENIRDYTYKPHTASQPMVFEIQNFKAECDTDYAVKLEFRNMQIYARQGYVQFTKTYAVRTSCCEGCETCPSGSCVELAQLLLQAFNGDESGMFTAQTVVGGALLTVTTAPTADGNITVSIGDLDIVVAVLDLDTAAQVATKIAAAIDAEGTYNATPSGTTVQISALPSFTTVVSVAPAATGTVVSAVNNSEVVDLDAVTLADGVCPGLRITANGLAINKFCNVNTRYYNPRQTVIIPSLVEGFNCTGVLTVTQQAVPEEGHGYDIKQKEYHAGGWNGRPGPYRASTATGLAYDGFQYFADDTVKYDQIQLIYDQFSTAGWGEYLNNLLTIVAIPEADTVTRNAFITAMDSIVASLGLEALADDAAAASTNPAVVEPAITDPTKDGIA